MTGWRGGICGLLLWALVGCAQQPVTVPAPEQEAPMDAVVASLLTQAEQALAAGRLMSPSSDNAFDRYRAVLLLSPENMDATSGIQLILVRYLELGRAALAKSRLDDASAYLGRAQTLSIESPLLLELEAQIKARRSEIRRIEAQALAVDQSTVWLSDNELSDRTPVLDQQLQAVAERIGRTQESLLIVARSDAEGRWLYKQIKRALSGYRLRGDIRVGARAYLQFQPTLD